MPTARNQESPYSTDIRKDCVTPHLLHSIYLARKRGTYLMTFHPKVLKTIAITAACFLGLNAADAARMEDLHATRNVDDINKQHGPTPATLNVQDKARRHAEILKVPTDSTLRVLQDPQKDKVCARLRR